MHSLQQQQEGEFDKAIPETKKQALIEYDVITKNDNNDVDAKFTQ